MSYTGVLWLLMIFLALIIAGFIKYVFPLLKRIDHNLNLMANYHNALAQEIEQIRSASLQARDHCADIKQELKINGDVG